MNKKIVFVLATLAIAPLSLSAQSPEARINAAKSRATSAGVPVSLLETRIAEGRAKGIPMDRIAAAVEQRTTSLVNAREAMGRGRRDLTAADLNAGADALAAGVPGGALRSVIEKAQGDDRPVAVAVLTYLIERGQPVDQALARVSSALEKGPDALRNLPNESGADRARGRGRPEEPGNRGRGSPNAGKGNRGGGGPPKALPAPGKKPGAGKPDNVGKGNQGGQGKGGGKGNRP